MVGRVSIGPPTFAEELVKMAQDHYSRSADLAVKIKTAMDMGRAQALRKHAAKTAVTKVLSKGRKAATKALGGADDATKVVSRGSKAVTKPAKPSAIQQAAGARGGVKGRAGEALADIAPQQYRGRDDLISTPLNQKSMWTGASPEVVAGSERAAARGMQNVQANRAAAMAPPTSTVGTATANIRPPAQMPGQSTIGGVGPMPAPTTAPVQLPPPSSTVGAAAPTQMMAPGTMAQGMAPTMSGVGAAAPPAAKPTGAPAPAPAVASTPAPTPTPQQQPARQGMGLGTKIGLGAAGLGAVGIGGAVAGSQQPQGRVAQLPTPNMPNMLAKAGSDQRVGRVGISKVGGINLGKKLLGGAGKAVKTISDPTELAMKGAWKTWKAAPTWGKGLMAAGAVGGVGAYMGGKKAHTSMTKAHHRYQRGAHQYGRYGTSPWKRSYQM